MNEDSTETHDELDNSEIYAHKVKWPLLDASLEAKLDQI